MKHLKTIGDTTETPDGQFKILTEQGIKVFDHSEKDDFDLEVERVQAVIKDYKNSCAAEEIGG
jgi:hypothetical protein